MRCHDWRLLAPLAWRFAYEAASLVASPAGRLAPRALSLRAAVTLHPAALGAAGPQTTPSRWSTRARACAPLQCAAAQGLPGLCRAIPQGACAGCRATTLRRHGQSDAPLAAGMSDGAARSCTGVIFRPVTSAPQRSGQQRGAAECRSLLRGLQLPDPLLLVPVLQLHPHLGDGRAAAGAAGAAARCTARAARAACAPERRMAVRSTAAAREQQRRRGATATRAVSEPGGAPAAAAVASAATGVHVHGAGARAPVANAADARGDRRGTAAAAAAAPGRPRRRQRARQARRPRGRRQRGPAHAAGAAAGAAPGRAARQRAAAPFVRAQPPVAVAHRGGACRCVAAGDQPVGARGRAAGVCGGARPGHRRGEARGARGIGGPGWLRRPSARQLPHNQAGRPWCPPPPPPAAHPPTPSPPPPTPCLHRQPTGPTARRRAGWGTPPSSAPTWTPWQIRCWSRPRLAPWARCSWCPPGSRPWWWRAMRRRWG